MLDTLKLHLSQNRALIIATVVSLLFHTLLISKFSLRLPAFEVEQKSLTLHLVNLNISHINHGLPKENSRATAVTETPLPPDNSTEHQVLPVETTTIDVLEAPVNSNVTQNISSNDQENTTLRPEATTEVSEITEAIDDPALTSAAIRPTTPLYQYVETTFEVYRGGDITAAGETRNIFNIDKNGTYILSSITQAKGLASLVFGKLTQKSEGTVTEKGLVPSFFYYQYGDDQAKVQTARFIWNDRVLQMHSAKDDKLESLVDGTQDLLSFMYQFMFSPPLENTQITMTNGKYLRTYTYNFEGEESIHTQLGDLKTIHLLKAGVDEEKTEIWLSIDYQYIPIKIKKTEKNGNVIEQIVTNVYTKLAD